MSKIVSAVVIILIISSSLVFAATAERPMMIRVNLEDKSAIAFLRSGNFDVTYVSPGEFAEVVADDGDYSRLEKSGLSFEVVHPDLVAFYQSRFPVGATMGGFRTLSEALAYMDSLHEAFPTLTTARDSVGHTIEGRALWMMKISDNPDVDEDEPEYFVNSLIHAREPMGMEACLRFMFYLLDNYNSDPEIAALVNEREFYFIPVVNPDGYEYNRITQPNGGGMHRKNRNPTGNVDLNRNWGYMWGYDNNGSSPDSWSETYRGMAAFSEPETQSMRQFVNSRHFTVALNIHSYGNLFLYPWGYFNGFTPDQETFVIIGDSACASNNYDVGTPWQLLYNTNGDACDWQYGEQAEKPKIFTFVSEIGSSSDGFWPSPGRIPTLWNDIRPAMLHLARVAANPYAIGAPVPPVLDPIGEINADSFTVSWVSEDTLNPAVSFELKEMVGLERLEDSFEDGTANWILNRFQLRTNRRHSGAYSLFSGTENNYNGSAISANSISFGQHDTLSVWCWYNIENNYDYAYVSLTTDGGVTFANLEGNITTNYNPNGPNQGNGITGNSNGWVHGLFLLDSYAGQAGQLALRYVTDGGVQNEGFYADEFFPLERFSSETVLDSDIQESSFVVSGRSQGDYYYQVRAKDAENQWSGYSNREVAIVYPQTGVDNSPVPAAFSLNQNYPNPFNPQTSISFTLPQKSLVELSVYNILGKRVRSLLNSESEAGEHSVLFDGNNDSGQQIAAGVYFYKLNAGDFSQTRKMLFLK